VSPLCLPVFTVYVPPPGAVGIGARSLEYKQRPPPDDLCFAAGTSIDQGIAYLLMIMALVLTYLIHPLDASAPYKLF
jgi:hypothetical protein